MKHTVNYMQVEGGHCFVCHKDYKGPDHNSPECIEKAIKREINVCGKINGKECEYAATPELKEEKWEEELMTLISEGHEAVINREEVEEYRTKVKSFIQNLLTTQREEIKAEILKKKKLWAGQMKYKYIHEFVDVDDILTIISKRDA